MRTARRGGTGLARASYWSLRDFPIANIPMRMKKRWLSSAERRENKPVGPLGLTVQPTLLARADSGDRVTRPMSANGTNATLENVRFSPVVRTKRTSVVA
jgi:hypothetical protein